MYYKFILICFLSIVTLDAEEISAFGAGDLSSPNPYGLTSVEESVLKNKNKSDKLDTNIKTVNNSLESINERMDGLNTVIEGDSQKLHTTTIRQIHSTKFTFICISMHFNQVVRWMLGSKHFPILIGE